LTAPKQSIASGRASTPPPGAWGPLRTVVQRAVGPLERFLHVEAASGVALLLAALVAFVSANAPWSASYAAFWHMQVGVQLGPFAFARSLEWVVNDGLMVIFFFVVGLEIRREIYAGELSELRRAALPIIAALGGVAVPAAVYFALTTTPEARSGWAVPTATDIAFAVGVLALLGKRVPPALRVLLLALAVIDDLLAILVIATFYSSGIEWFGLLIAGSGLAAVLVLKAAGVRIKAAYVLPGLVVWAGTYAAGVHPTIAGVVLGFITPVQAWLGAEGFLEAAPRHYEALTRAVHDRPDDAHAFANAMHPLSVARREASSPAESLIAALHPWVAFAIMPMFALANAGVSVRGMSLEGASGVIAIAVFVGLLFGKPIGIMLLSEIALRLGIAQLPAGITRMHLLVLGVVAGIGFTMALFVAQLAFLDETLLAAAKLGVLCASTVAGVLGWLLGRFLLAPSDGRAGVARNADEAECSTEL
jgi:Na+:H+ antiporter, NhaA family